jgi:membrane-associated phospholipid phosphatase
VRPSERLTVGFALIVALLALALRPDGYVPRVVVLLAIAAATLLLARHSTGPRTPVRDWLPVVAVLACYMVLQPIIEVSVPWRLDERLAAIDARYFSGLLDAWRGALGRPAAFTDAVYVAYLSYYFLPIVAAALAWRRDSQTFEHTVFAVLLSFYLTYLGYLLMPASGPRLAASDEARLLGGGAISEAARLFLRTAEATTLDAFPSGHTTVAVVSAAVGSALCRPAGALGMWAWAAAIVFAAVYVHVHYVVDIVVGLALAAVVLVVSAWRGRGERPGPGPRAGADQPTATNPYVA